MLRYLAEVVDDERDCDWRSAAGEETWGVGGGDVAVSMEVLDEAIEGKDAGLWESIHALAYFGHGVLVIVGARRLYYSMMPAGMYFTGTRTYSHWSMGVPR